ncbi:MAG: hypothetical protein IJE93_07835 [Clostridia bacterium]|nr:hypothetical protein [Clostridia bacterium]
MTGSQINRVRKDIKVISTVSKLNTIMKFIKVTAVIGAILIIGRDVFLLSKAE